MRETPSLPEMMDRLRRTLAFYQEREAFRAQQQAHYAQQENRHREQQAHHAAGQLDPHTAMVGRRRERPFELLDLGGALLGGEGYGQAGRL